MALARNLLARRLHSLLEPQNVAFVNHIIHSNSPHSYNDPPSHHRSFASSSSQTLAESDRTLGLKSLYSLFQAPPERRSDPKNEKLKRKSKQGEAVSLSEKTGDKESVVGRVKDVEKKPDKKLRKSRESKVKFVQEEEEVVKGKLQGKPKQGEAVSLSEKTEHKESKVGRVEGKKKKLKKKLKKPKKWKVKFIEEEEEEEEVVKGEKPKKPEPNRLYDLFSQGEKSNEANPREDNEEEVVKGKQPEKPEPKRLHDLFSQGKKSNKANPRRFSPGIAPVETHKEVKQREPLDLKKLSSDMETFLSYLYKEGYFRDANFVKDKKFDLSWFDIEYARYYTLSAAQKFGKDKQEISKWLSGSDLKQVAMFGCPSSNKSQVFPSKTLRNYFKIPENTVCSKCVLRDSCKFVNQSVWRTDKNNLDLAIAMKVICSYAMSLVDPPLVVPDKVNNSVNRLLKEVLKLSQTFF